jgi:hypothetical protein
MTNLRIAPLGTSEVRESCWEFGLLGKFEMDVKGEKFVVVWIFMKTLKLKLGVQHIQM